VIAAATIAAYGRTFAVPQLLDDGPSISDNPTLRHLGSALFPPGYSTVGGRPFLNLTLAADYAFGGTSVGIYHATNLAVHVLAGLVLYGVVRRTLERLGEPGATLTAFLAALIWSVHPLQTGAVTYIIQRAESLMGLLYLFSLYAVIRGAGAAGRAPAWYALGVASCLLGMATKEVMVSAPLIILLYDRTFLAGSFREALRLRWPAYAGLAATWLLMPYLILSTHGRGGTAGFGSGVAWWSYAATQVPALAHYLRLCLWPHPLIFDYGGALVAPSAELIIPGLLLAALLLGTAWALPRDPPVGFLGAAFFAVLAPSSSVVPVVTETMAEHRMYLPLAAVAVLAVCGLRRLMPRGSVALLLAASAALLWATWSRNETYRSEEAILADTVEHRPGNERARNNLGNVLDAEGRTAEAVAQFEEALRIDPSFAEAHSNLGNALARDPGRMAEALVHCQEAVRLKPSYAKAHNNLGNVLARTPGRIADAIGEFQEALRLDPDYPDAHNNLGNALDSTGRSAEAIPQFEEALRLKPDFPEAHSNLGNALTRIPGRLGDAVAQYEEALRQRPDYATAHNNLASTLRALGRTDEALAHYEAALRLRPDSATIHVNIAMMLLGVPGRRDEAVEHLRAALRLQPANALARSLLEQAGDR
jgi:tetratricopeptide (TPR) repeat protein